MDPSVDNSDSKSSSKMKRDVSTSTFDYQPLSPTSMLNSMGRGDNNGRMATHVKTENKYTQTLSPTSTDTDSDIHGDPPNTSKSESDKGDGPSAVTNASTGEGMDTAAGIKQESDVTLPDTGLENHGSPTEESSGENDGGDMMTRDQQGSACSHLAASEDYRTLIQLLMDNISADKGEVSQYMNECDEEGRRTMLHGLLEGRMDVVQLLVNAGRDMRPRDKEGRTCLHLAALEGYKTVIQFLLENISEDNDKVSEYVNERDKDGRTALLYASGQGHLDVVQMLVSAGGDIRTRDRKGSTSLHLAAFYGHKSVIQFLLENISEDKDEVIQYMNEPDEEGRTAMFYASQEGRANVVELLVSAGGDMRALDNQGAACLQIAAFFGRITVIQILLKNISEDKDEVSQYVNERNENGRTAMLYALQRGYVGILQLLVNAGGEMRPCENQGITDLHVAAFFGHKSVTQFLLKNFSEDKDEVSQYVNESDEKGRTPMSYASEEGHVDVLELLVSVGGDMRPRDKQGCTCLHLAAFFGRETVIQFLLKNISADKDEVSQYVNERDKEGRTAMLYASQEGHAGIVELLVSAGGDMTIHGNQGATCIHVAAY